ncbi:MAG: FecR domain-containing protein [Kiritimatiellia bacterium]
MKQAVFIFTFLTSSFPGGADPSAGLTHTLLPGESMKDLAVRYMDGPEDVYELLRYNGIENPAQVAGGMIISLPGEVRTRARDALARAEAAMGLSMDAMGPRFAAPEHQAAATALAQARDAAGGPLRPGPAVVRDRRAPRARRPTPRCKTSGPPILPGSPRWRVSWRSPPTLEKPGNPPGRAIDRRQRPDSFRRTFPRRGDVGQRLRPAASESSQMTASRLEVNRKSGARRTELKVILGDILGEIVPKDEKKKDETFDIKSSKSSISIRGTVLKVGADPAGASRISMFEGATEVTAGGRSQELVKDFGMVVSPRGEASGPLRLIAAPRLDPAGGITSATQRVRLRWSPTNKVEHLSSWVVELAKDRAFNQVVELVRPPAREHLTGVLSEGRYFWRVHGVDRDGLAGPPSEPCSIVIQKDTRIELRSEPPAVEEGGLWHVRGTHRFTASAVAEVNSIGQVRATVDGKSRDGAIIESLPEGRHTLEWTAVALDGEAGGRIRLEVLVDDRGPVVRVGQIPPAAGLPPARQFITFTPVAEDPSGVALIEWSHDRRNWTRIEAPPEVSVLLPRYYSFRATDRLGNVGDVETVNVPGSPVTP